MTSELARLVGANFLMLAAGAGLLPLLGAARTARELGARIGLAYAAGLAAVGVAAAVLAPLRVPLGWALPATLAAVSVAGGAVRLHRSAPVPLARRSRGERALAVAALLLLAILFVRAWRAFAVVPVLGWDAWSMWTLKARALLELGWADPAVFASDAYAGANLAYPLLVPAVEALGFHAMGGFRSQEILVQFLFFGVALVGGLHGVLRDVVPPWLLWPSLLAIAAAPAVLGQLLTAYADLPLAAFVAVAAAAGARWLLRGERWALGVTSLFLAAALLTKYEAPLFAGGILLGLGAVALRRGRSAVVPLAVAAAAAAAPLALWLAYVGVHGLSTGHAATTFNPGVGPIALEWLSRSALDPSRWGLLVPLFLAATAVALAFGPRRLALFALAATLLPLGGLVVNYVVSPIPHTVYLEASADRVVSSIVLAGAALVPLLAAELVRQPRPRAGAAPGGGTAP